MVDGKLGCNWDFRKTSGMIKETGAIRSHQTLDDLRVLIKNEPWRANSVAILKFVLGGELPTNRLGGL